MRILCIFLLMVILSGCSTIAIKINDIEKEIAVLKKENSLRDTIIMHNLNWILDKKKRGICI